MTLENRLDRDANRAERQNHSRDIRFKKSWPYFAAAMRTIIGTDLPSAIAADLGIATQTVRDWRNGRCGIPIWVLEIARQRLAQWQRKAELQAADLSLCYPAPGSGSHKRKTPAP